MRYPAPLRPGDVIGVTSPSSGVPESLRPRLDVCVADLRDRGFEVEVGECMDGSGPVSAPAADRAAELTAMLTDHRIRAVVPPRGGALAIDLLPLARNPRAKMLGVRDGFIKIFAHAGTGTVLGAVVVGPRASESIYPLTLAVTHRLTTDQLAETATVYPSMSGTIAEVARILHHRIDD